MILDGDYSFSSVDFNGELANILWGCYVDCCFFLKLSADPWLNAELATLINGEIDIFELIKKLSIYLPLIIIISILSICREMLNNQNLVYWYENDLNLCIHFTNNIKNKVNYSFIIYNKKLCKMLFVLIIISFLICWIRFTFN